MSRYIITDVHFHTDDSFDAYQHEGKGQFDIEEIISKRAGETNQGLELLCKTDHNVLNFQYYKTLKSSFNAHDVKVLPGIEVNTTNKIHWLFIFDDTVLESTNEVGDELGELLDIEFQSIFGYSTKLGTVQERKSAQLVQQSVEVIVRRINSLGIPFLAIPHFNKTNGWYDHIKQDSTNLGIINYLISDNIIVGFESKNQEEDLIRNIVNTQTHLEQKLKEFEEGTLTDITQVTQREEHLEKLLELKEMFESNDVSIVYGSDFHGGNYSLESLFYMKAEKSFEGLKFALLDPYSRLFSERRRKRYSKDSNYVLEAIKFKGLENPVKLGDGLNSIIGPRGSGKSYLLKSLIGKNSEYSGSKISEVIEVDEVILSEGTRFPHLQSNHYDIISQKNSVSKENSKNIYNLLSEAPYDYNKFETELANNFIKNQESSNQVKSYFTTANQLINSYLALDKQRNNIPDFSSIDSYNVFYQSKTDEVSIVGKFDALTERLNNIKKSNVGKIELLSKTNTSAADFIGKLKELVQINEVEKLKLIDKVTNILDNVESFEEEIYLPVTQRVNMNSVRIGNVLTRLESINKRLRESKSNTQLVLNDHIGELKSYINQSVTKLKESKKLEQSISKFENQMSDTTLYKFEQDEFVYHIRLIKTFDKSNVTESYFNQIFSKYRNQDSSEKAILNRLFESNDFGEEFIKLHNHKDNRFSDSYIGIPKIPTEVYLSLNNTEFEKWDALSPGQRSDILLNIILDTSSKRILIIDQPEDDLDNEMIYKTIVRKLRKLKLKKQVIVVSHNANVVITGDSDTITVCQNFENEFKMSTDIMESKQKINYKSINTTMLNDSVLNVASLILDGGNEALKRRVKKIGYKKLFFNEVE